MTAPETRKLAEPSLRDIAEVAAARAERVDAPLVDCIESSLREVAESLQGKLDALLIKNASLQERIKAHEEADRIFAQDFDAATLVLPDGKTLEEQNRQMQRRIEELENGAESLIHMLQKLEARSDVSEDWRRSIRSTLIWYRRALAAPAPTESEPKKAPPARELLDAGIQGGEDEP